MIHEGQLLRSLVKTIKREKGMSRADVAERIGISPEHLSTIYNRESLTAEIKARAIKALDLPPDYFDGKDEGLPTAPKIDWQAEAARLDAELRAIKDKYITLLEKVNAEKEGGDKEKLEYILRGR